MLKLKSWAIVLAIGLMSLACTYEVEVSDDTPLESTVSAETMSKVHGPGTYVVTVEGMN